MDGPLSEGLFGKGKRQKLQDQLSEVELEASFPVSDARQRRG